MKNVILTIATVVLFALGIQAQNDTMYVMKNGVIVSKFNVNTEVDSVIFYSPSLPGFTCGNPYTDSRDGHVYTTVQIGNQCWMSENLAYLPGVAGPGTGSLTEPYYYVYGYDGTDVNAAIATENYTTYGALYNWAAAMAGSASSNSNPSEVKGVCPAGWHMPSDAEWTQLTDYLGGENVAGGKLKETGTTHWNSPNTGATNETGFTALPGGGRGFNGVWTNDMLYTGYWWSTTENPANPTFEATLRYMSYNNTDVSRVNTDKGAGLSVRCLKD
jgi:uncharacterized protein (TIGR02145 family)